MKILRTILSVAFVLIASVSAQAQINQLPHLSYYPQQVTLNDGKFKDAIKAYQSEVRGAMKSVSSRWIDSICAYTMLGEAYYAVSLVYQSTRQLREMTPLSPETPPMKVPVRFEGVQTDENGLIAEADMLALLDRALDAYDALIERYDPEEYALDDAA